jgi:hypothetical protein
LGIYIGLNTYRKVFYTYAYDIITLLTGIIIPVRREGGYRPLPGRAKLCLRPNAEPI